MFRGLQRVLVCLGLGAALAGCGGGMRSPVPEVYENNAHVADMGPEMIRFWGDELPPHADAYVKKVWAQKRASRSGSYTKDGRPVVNYLAISGGGSDGAYGAGLIGGWTASGKRPKFDVVTGVSTGALTAPFAFLGPKYDKAMKHVYTQTSTKDVAILRPVRGLIGGDALASNAPLAKVIAHYVNDDFLREVAAEHGKGRRLLIGTTNLDAERPVVWDMGEIAASGSPGSLQLFRDVLLASAAIPAVFPPAYVKVAANGAVHDEMHVDGGATRQVFLMPTQFMSKVFDPRSGVKPVRRAYIIRNGRVTPSYKPVKSKTLAIAGRAVSSLIKAQGVGDLYELYEFSQVNNIDYNLAYIPGDFPDTSTSAFDEAYMNRLYELGYQQGGQGYRWHKKPPRLGGD